MSYVIIFVAGMAAGASIPVIWYFSYIAQLRKERRSITEEGNRLQSYSLELTRQANDLDNKRQDVDRLVAAFDTRKVRYDDLAVENASLKQDLFNLSVKLKKTDRDHGAITRTQEEVDARAKELAQRYLDENVSWISSKLSSKNFTTCKNRLLKVIDKCREIGFEVPQQREEQLVQDLKEQFEQAVRAEFQREEQARIRAQIREEERLAREIDKQVKDAERERAAVEAALEKALKDTHDEHSAEVEHLKARLREAEENAERAKSRAQMTKAGHVYVISNIGSFGEGVYKIGMTRRLEPMLRVKELGDASVPFPFDVHMMISCDDAPSLENALHRELHRQRLNRVNFRKEFFRVEIDAIRGIVESQHGEVDYLAEPEALEYRETQEMTDDDYEFVEKTMDSLSDDEDDAGSDE